MAASTRSTPTNRLTFSERTRDTGTLARQIIDGAIEKDLAIRAVAYSVVMDFEDYSLGHVDTPTDKRPKMPVRVEEAKRQTTQFHESKAGFTPRHVRLGIRLGVDAIYGGGRVSYGDSTIEAETAKVNQRITDNLERSRIDRENREKAAQVASASAPSTKPKTRKRPNAKSKGTTPVTMPTPKQPAAQKKRRHSKAPSKVVTKS